jgi:alpha-L-arabinofuranosidase
MRALEVPLVDEHYYRSPDWFLQHAARYDSYDRKGPKVFAGEYAAHDKEGKEAESRNTWKSALAEAAFMTGLERNADVVHLASYAPLLGNVDAWQWRPDLIWFDNQTTVATPNYYVQKLFSTNAGTEVISALVDGKPLTGQDSLYASACIDSSRESGTELVIKIVNVAGKPTSLNISVEGSKVSAGEISLQVLTNADLTAFNQMGKPEVVTPAERKQKISGKKIMLALDARSLTVARIALKK